MDHAAHLNLFGPRDFLLQIEDELDSFVHSITSAGSNADTLEEGLNADTLEQGRHSSTQGATSSEEVKVENDGPTSAHGGTAEEACVVEAKAETRETISFDAPVSLAFPMLAKPYSELLATAARRYGLDVESPNARAVLLVADPKHPPALPLLSYADFLRPQRPASPPPAAAAAQDEADASARLRSRLLLRLWALRLDPAASGASEAARLDGEGSEVKELRASSEAIFAAKATAAGRRVAKKTGASDRLAAGAEDGWRPGQGAAKRGRGFGAAPADEATETPRESVPARLDYKRFTPGAAMSPMCWRDDLLAPWPTVKLRRLRAPSVVWRPEWRVGPDVDDPVVGGPQQGSRGGVISWAVDSSTFASGEGFEVNLRAGPGPDEDLAAGGAPSATPPPQDGEAAANPDRDDDDFVLSFRRGEGAWHFTAGRRAKLAGLASKRLEDRGSKITRCSFWAACLESLSDGKHYVLVGSIPGILIEHVFVAKVARTDPLSHAGFSYLPTPQIAAFGDAHGGEQGKPVVIESITVFPHGLTGELPFTSLRFVEQGIAGEDAAGVLARVAVSEAKCEPGGTDEPDSRLELRVLRAPAVGSSAADRTAQWCNPSLRECGLRFECAKDVERRAERRAKRARTAVQLATNGLEAPVSWEPQSAELPQLGPFEDTLRHDPSQWKDL